MKTKEKYMNSQFTVLSNEYKVASSSRNNKNMLCISNPPPPTLLLANIALHVIFIYID